MLNLHHLISLPISLSAGLVIALPSMVSALFVLELGKASDMATVTQVKERADGPLLHFGKSRGKH